MDPDGRQTADGRALDDNVVRLPRDWLGPRDELIPLGSSANGQSGAQTASDFWGEASSSLQSALEAPPPPREAVAARRALPPRYARSLGVAAVAAALLVGLVVFATGSHKPSVGRASTPGSAQDLAIAARTQRALDWSASRPGGPTAERGARTRHRATTRVDHRADRATRHTVIVEQVRYVSARAQSSGSASVAPSSPSTGSSSAQASSASSNPAAGSVNQPAVGANGALGPGTSPDG